MDANELIRNCSAHTLEELAPYVGQYVAWSEDGRHVLAHANTWDDLFKEVDRQGITHYVIDYVPCEDDSFLGGAGL